MSATQPPPTEAREHEVWCHDPHKALEIVTVWKRIQELTKQHYAGPTAEQIKDGTTLSTESINEAFTALRTYDPENGPIKIAYCQEGTAGPYATRFCRKKDHIINIKIKPLLSEGWKITCQ